MQILKGTHSLHDGQVSNHQLHTTLTGLIKSILSQNSNVTKFGYFDILTDANVREVCL
jgi:hypothetical protein